MVGLCVYLYLSRCVYVYLFVRGREMMMVNDEDAEDTMEKAGVV